MDWGTVEQESEVWDWLRGLPKAQRGTALFQIKRLAAHGPSLREPRTRQLRGKLRELRFRLDPNDVRVTYWIASGKRIVLLTVFCKTQRREERQIERAWRMFQRCMHEPHTPDMHYRGVPDG